MELHVAQADIATLPVDALVVPCDSMGEISPGIREIIGDNNPMEGELKEKAPLAVGAAMIADAGELGARNAIAVPIIRHAGDEVATELLRRAVKAALVAANMKQYESIALPTMVREEPGPTMAEAARAVVQEIQSHKKPFPEKVYMVDSEESTVRIFKAAIQHAQYSL